MKKHRMADYWASDEWAKMKVDLLILRGNTCQSCGKEREDKHLVVHHLNYDRFKNEDYRDVVLLCHHCHAIIHGKVKERSGKKKHQKKRIENNIAPGRKIREEKVNYKKVCTVCGSYMNKGKEKWSCVCGREIDKTTRVFKTKNTFAIVRTI